MLPKDLYQSDACCERRQAEKSQNNINEFMASLEMFNHARRQAL